MSGTEAGLFAKVETFITSVKQIVTRYKSQATVLDDRILLRLLEPFTYPSDVSGYTGNLTWLSIEMIDRKLKV